MARVVDPLLGEVLSRVRLAATALDLVLERLDQESSSADVSEPRAILAGVARLLIENGATDPLEETVETSFRLWLRTGNDAFAGERLRYELARILLDLSAKLQRELHVDGRLLDVNGNTVGGYVVELPS